MVSCYFVPQSQSDGLEGHRGAAFLSLLPWCGSHSRTTAPLSRFSEAASASDKDGLCDLRQAAVFV